MLNIEKPYIAPKVGLVRLQLEDLMADVSCWPTIKTGMPEYYEFEDYSDLPEVRDVFLF
jgi:hypothetical protein